MSLNFYILICQYQTHLFIGDEEVGYQRSRLSSNHRGYSACKTELLMLTFLILLAGGKYTDVLERVSDLVRSSPTETKIRALRCMASLIGYQDDPNAPKTGPIDHRVTLMTREWFRMMSVKPEAMEALMGICKNPFPEIRTVAFTLLDAVVQHRWGEELVARTPGMFVHSVQSIFFSMFMFSIIFDLHLL